MILCVREYVLYTIYLYTYKVIPHIGTRTVSKVCIFDFIRMYYFYYYYYYYYRHAFNITNYYTNVCVCGVGGNCVYAYNAIKSTSENWKSTRTISSNYIIYCMYLKMCPPATSTP